MIGGEIEIMKNLYFDDFEDLACDIADNFDMVKDDFGDIAIIAKYEEAKEIISELSCIGYSLESIRMSRPEWENYHDEYLISLNNDGIWCEEMKSDGKYLPDESTITYILDNCSSAVIPYCKGKIVFEVTVGIDEDDCNFDDCSECACKKDEKPATASSKSVYKVNGKEVSKEKYEKVLDKFSDKYMDSVQDRWLNHMEVIDEMRNFAKLFNW